MYEEKQQLQNRSEKLIEKLKQIENSLLEKIEKPIGKEIKKMKLKTADDFYKEVVETNLKCIELLDKVEQYKEKINKMIDKENKMKEEVTQLKEVSKNYEEKENNYEKILASKEDDWRK